MMNTLGILKHKPLDLRQGAWPLALGLVAGASLWVAAAIWARPDAIFSDTFLWLDGAHNLVVCQQILRGKLYFRDIFNQYGLLPTYVYAAIAAVFGNTPSVYIAMVASVTILNVWLMYCLMKGRVSVPTTLLISFILVFPVFLLPGSFTAGHAETMYYGFERAGLLIIIMLWRPAIINQTGRSFLLGMCIGLLQTIKFGGAFVVGLAIIIVDVCFLIRAGFIRSTVVCFARNGSAILGGFAMVEAGLAIAAFAAMPRAMALDYLWPTYMLQGYGSYVTPATRGFAWMGASFFIARQLAPLCALAMAVGTAILLFVDSAAPCSVRDRRFGGRLLILALFYVVGLAVYFKHIWLVYGYVWALMLSTAWAFDRAGWRARGLFIAACLPCLLVNLKSLAPGQRSPNLHYEAVFGSSGLWLSKAAIQRLGSLQKVLTRLQAERDESRRGIIIIPEGGGLHVAYRVPPVTRHTWFMPGMFRSYDESTFLSEVDGCCALCCLSDVTMSAAPPLNPARWPFPFRGTPFTENLGRALADKLDNPIEIDENCWVFPVRQSVSPALELPIAQ